MFSKYKAYIFDLDGTLYDNRKMGFNLVRRDLLHITYIKGERVARSKLRGIEFPSKEDFYKRFFAEAAAVAGVSVEKYSSWYTNKYKHVLTRTLKNSYKGHSEALDVFKKLRESGAKVSVYSDYCGVEARMTALQLPPESVDFAFDAEEFGALKPAASPFLKIAGKMGQSPENILVIGDRTVTDGKGAKLAGMDFVHINDKLSQMTQVDVDGKNYPAMTWKQFATEILK